MNNGAFLKGRQTTLKKIYLITTNMAYRFLAEHKIPWITSGILTSRVFVSTIVLKVLLLAKRRVCCGIMLHIKYLKPISRKKFLSFLLPFNDVFGKYWLFLFTKKRYFSMWYFHNSLVVSRHFRHYIRYRPCDDLCLLYTSPSPRDA